MREIASAQPPLAVKKVMTPKAFQETRKFLRSQLPSFICCTMLALCLAGCGSGGGPSGRPDIDAIPDAELRGSAAKALLYEFRARVRKHGVAGAKAALPEVLENFEGYTHLPPNEHSETYAQIMEKLKSMEGTLAGSPSKEALVEVVEEIGKLADTLPGKADDKPVVE